MRTYVQKWGNSLGLRIPKAFGVELSLDAGCEVDLVVEGGRILVKPVCSWEQELGSLLARVTVDGCGVCALKVRERSVNVWGYGSVSFERPCDGRRDS